MILAPLYERQRTGKGRLVECSLLETAIGFSSWTSAQWLTDHEEPTRQGSRHRQNAPYQRMQTKDGYLMVGASGEAIRPRCAKALGHPEWCEDPRFATNQARMANREALEAVMNAVLTTKTTSDWVEMLEAAGVPCDPVYDCAQMFANPQVRHRGLVQYASNPELGEVPHIRTPVKIGEGVRVRNVAPKLGEHNTEIFGRLGVRKGELQKLRNFWVRRTFLRRTLEGEPHRGQPQSSASRQNVPHRGAPSWANLFRANPTAADLGEGWAADPWTWA